jgi:hypothetical protein
MFVFCWLLLGTCAHGRATSRVVDVWFDPIKSVVNLRTSVAYLRKDIHNRAGQHLHIDLTVISTLHVADKTYYDQVQHLVQNCSTVLFELITSAENTSVGGKNAVHKKRLTRPVQAKIPGSLLSDFSLCSQLDMDLTRPNWYIADLDAATVASLESQSTDKRNTDFIRSVAYGRGRLFPFLKNFYVSDTPLLNALRLLAWLAPCPELACLLIDWARAQPQASVSPLLVPMLDHLTDALTPFAHTLPNWDGSRSGVTQSLFDQLLCNLRKRRESLRMVRKLAFAQQILSGVADSGAWGGETRSDISVRVYARNAECCRILDAFVEEAAQTSDISANCTGRVEIAVIYGAYHIADLTKRLCEEHAYCINTGNKSVENLTAWSIPLSRNCTKPSGASTQARTLVTAAVIAAVYLVVNAVDWWVLLQLLTHLVQEITMNAHIYGSFSGSSTRDMTSAASMALMSAGKVALYAVLYVLRHNAILRSLSYSAVHWDKGLFAECE